MDPTKSTIEEEYKEYHSKVRDCVEGMFGVIKQRFEILLNGFHMKDVEHIKMVTESCFLLHNYLREVESPFPHDIWEDIILVLYPKN